MLKRKLTQSDYYLIAVNLLPVAGVWLWDWSPNEVFLVYCLETIMIGIFNLVKMGIVTATRKTDTWYNGTNRTNQSGLFFMFFFLLHYGIFTGVQMGIFFSVSGIGEGSNITAFNFFYKWPQLLSLDAMVMFLVFVSFYGFKMIVNFIRSGEYRTIPMTLLLFQPYGRIFIQQVTVIIGSMFLTFGAGKIFILVFALIKIFVELFIDLESILRKGLKGIEKESGKQ